MSLDIYRRMTLFFPMLILPLSSCAGSISPQPTPTNPVGLGGGEQDEEARLYINFTVEPEVASDLLSPQPRGQAAREILDIASSHGLTVEQLHPGIDDPLMSRNFFIAVPDQETAQAIVSRLQGLQGVESAYFTPPGEPPGESPGGAPF